MSAQSLRGRAHTSTVVLERVFATTLLCAGFIAQAAPYATAMCTSLAVAWHYPDDEVLFLAKCFVLIWLVAYVFTFSAFAELMMRDG